MSVSWMDVIAGALKFLVRMFWHRSSVPSEFFFSHSLRYLDGVMPLLDLVRSADQAGEVTRILGAAGQLCCFPSLSALRLLLLIPRAHYSWLGMRFCAGHDRGCGHWGGVDGGGRCPRDCGRVWSSERTGARRSVSAKDHELIRMGPYRIMRHPILYGHVAGACLGTALVVGEVRGPPGPGHRGARFSTSRACKEEAFLARNSVAGF